MKDQVESILNDMYNDISLNTEDKKELEDLFKNFILDELDKIKITLNNRVNKYFMSFRCHSCCH